MMQRKEPEHDSSTGELELPSLPEQAGMDNVKQPHVRHQSNTFLVIPPLRRLASESCEETERTSGLSDQGRRVQRSSWFVDIPSRRVPGRGQPNLTANGADLIAIRKVLTLKAFARVRLVRES